MIVVDFVEENDIIINKYINKKAVSAWKVETASFCCLILRNMLDEFTINNHREG